MNHALPTLLLLSAVCTACAESRTAPLLVLQTEASGLTHRHVHGGVGNRELPETMGGGVALLDYDGDGDLDVYLTQSGPMRTPGDREPRTGGRNALFANDGAAQFERVPRAADADDAGYGQGVVAGDWNGDGLDDLVVLNWGPNTLYTNTGGAFRDATKEAGLSQADEWSISAAFLDAEGDGDLDLYVVNYLVSPPGVHRELGRPDGFAGYPHPDRFSGAADRLYLSESGTLVDRTRESGCYRSSGKGLGVAITDIDLDGLVDLYVANDSTANFLFHNLSSGHFEEIGLSVGLAYNEGGQSEAGMGVDSGDIDNDGDFDLFVTNLDGETNTLYTSEPRGDRVVFADTTRRAGLAEPSKSLVGFGALFGDLDRDGDLDLFVVNGHVLDNAHKTSDLRAHAQPNQLFLGDGTGRFLEATPEQAGRDLERPTVSRGTAAGDLDGDGDLDLVIATNNGAAQLYKGNLQGGHWLALSLSGPTGNTRGLGASVWIELQSGERLLRRIESGRSYASSSAPVMVTGLPSPVRAIEVLWPGGVHERWEKLDGLEGDHQLAYGTGSK